MAKITPVYYLQSGTVKFWQKESATSSATIITPNAIVAKKQSLVEVSYHPFEKNTVVVVYKGEAEVADLVTGKKMILTPTNDGKPRVAIVSFASATPSLKPTETVVSPTLIKTSPESNIGTFIIVGFIVVVIVAVFYNRLKQWSLAKIQKGKNNE